MATMQRYLFYVMDEVRQSYANREQNSVNPDVSLANVPEKFRGIQINPMQKAHEWFKIDPAIFPPAEKWNDDQLLYLIAALRQLFEAYNMNIVMPTYMPYNVTYSFIIKALNEYVTCRIGDANCGEIEFCKNEPNECLFGEYCSNSGGAECDVWEYGANWDEYALSSEMVRNSDIEWP